MIRNSLILCFLLWTVACCTLNWRKQSAKEAPKTGVDRSAEYQQLVTNVQLRQDVQLASLKTADTLGANAVYGLFSEAGYVDAGQTVVFVLPDASAKVERTESAAKAVSKTFGLDVKTTAAFTANFPESALPDYTRPSFDGVRHELVIYRRSSADAPLKIQQKTFIMTLQEGPEAEPYQRIIGWFNDLLK